VDGKAALGFSGGIDSLASLRWNRLHHTPGDPEWFQLGVVLSSGFDEFEIMPGGWYWPSLEAIAADADLPLTSMTSNMRELDDSDHAFLSHLFGAQLASLGHALGATVSSYAIASSDEPRTRTPYGSHPDLDPLYSSGAMTIVNDLSQLGRYEKTALISDWEVLQGRLKVCLYTSRLPEGKLNCGECEKCIRTQLTLLALGALGDFPELPKDEITADDLDVLGPLSEFAGIYYVEIRDGLDAAGHDDLVQAINEKFADYRSGPREMLMDFDMRALGGLLKRTSRRVRERLTR
jgi:hypothetical protein